MEEYNTHSRAENGGAGPQTGRPAGPRCADHLHRRAGRRPRPRCARGIAEGLGCTDPVSSPTFAIVNYLPRSPGRSHHFDLYRVHTEGDLAAAGFYDYLDMGAVVAVEWSENCAEILARENPITIDIQRTGGKRPPHPGPGPVRGGIVPAAGPAHCIFREDFLYVYSSN